jgi:hypothetical protein
MSISISPPGRFLTKGVKNFERLAGDDDEDVGSHRQYLLQVGINFTEKPTNYNWNIDCYKISSTEITHQMFNFCSQKVDKIFRNNAQKN